ncbi:ISPpu14, transposase Orf2 [Pseudomonas amygdali pv. morsprunorum]|uniref:ISPpu14, transposase Orf2 n=3 Tax=Pseudomonas syringae group TaxID=136849 RepID=A0A3M2WKQ2_PSEA0|nr:ISPpu14, transposase Orf2 [Pseudomonas amygdali pv. morsprunorum]
MPTTGRSANVRHYRRSVRPSKPHREVATGRSRRVRPFYPWPHSMIRIDAIWLATEPMDMRAGTETALARVITVFGAAKPHCAYIFANRRANRMKVLVHDGIGVWLAARRLNQGKFHWPGIRQGSELELDADQLQALVLGLPWQRVGAGGAITIL